MRKILISVIFLGICFKNISSEEKNLVYYTVKKGDNLSLLSKKFKIPIQELKEKNNLKSNIIHPGQKLLIREEEKTEKNTVSTPSYKYSYTYYTVKKGDSLSKISKKFKVSMTQLKKMNNLKSSVIHPGQKLKVKVERIKEEPILVEPTPIMNVSQKTYYKVKKGDTLESIANQFNIEKEKLKQTNLLLNEQLKEGEIVVIPSPEAQNLDENNSETEISSFWNINLGEKIVQEAFRFLNTPYKFGGDGKKGIDCSGLTKLVYGKIGINLPNTSFSQYKLGTSIPIEEAEPGDLIFFRRGKKIGHVGIYIGNNFFIHASPFLKKVGIGSLENSYYKNHFVGIKRYIPENGHLFFREGEINVEQE